jgi:low affinity Fe/Cu permease
MKERKKAFLKNLILFVVFLIGTVFSIAFLVVGEFENWVLYQISINIMVTIIFFMGFFFFSALHYVIRKG